MIRALIFLIKAAALVAAAVWVAGQPGAVRIEWMDYVFTLQLGFFLLLSVGILLIAIFFYRVIQTFVDFPRSIKKRLSIIRREKGHRALTRGLSAVAAGDTKLSRYYAHRVQKFLPDDKGLALLLRAQSAKLDGHNNDAQQFFTALAQNPDTAFLGLRGLLQSALDANDTATATDIGRRALKMHPRQHWILKLVYELEIRARDWENAKKTLGKAESAGAIPTQKAASDRIAILLAQADTCLTDGFRTKAQAYMQQAVRYHPYFAPGVLRLARFYKQEGRRRKAVSLIERAWRKNPHPDLAQFWIELIPPHKSGKPMAGFSWYERLVTLNPTSAQSHLALAVAAAKEGLWGEAKDHFEKAESIEPSAEIYAAWVQMEKQFKGSALFLERLQQKSVQYPIPKHWICRETGVIFNEWQPIAEPHGAFNTIEWMAPTHHAAIAQNSARFITDGIIEAPR
jgi:HemY protein